MRDIDLFYWRQFPQIFQLYIILRTIQLNQVGKICQVVGIYANDPLVRNIGGDYLLRMLEV